MQQRGPCPQCCADRLLPGLADNVPVCRDCAGISRRFGCHRCGAEGRLYYGKVCVQCRLHDLAHELLADGTGTVPDALQPLISVLATGFATTPEARLSWLRTPRTRELLGALSDGNLALSHAALDAQPDQQRVRHLRALLVAAGCLPAVDRALHRFDTWLHQRLAELAGHPHERVLRRFGTWHHLAKMRAKAERQPLTENARTYAVLEFNRAVDFCTWLSQRNVTPEQLTQPALDRYCYATCSPPRTTPLRRAWPAASYCSTPSPSHASSP